MNRIQKKRLITTFVVAGGLVLTGCAGTQDPVTEPTTEPTTEAPVATPTETTTDPATPAPSPTEVDEALVIPGCDTLLPLDVLHSYEPWVNVELYEELTNVDDMKLDEVLGERAYAVSQKATKAQGCVYIVPQSDAGVQVDVLDIDPNARDGLIAELRAASDTYTEVTMADAVSFWTQVEGGLGGLTVTYTFAGNSWLIQHGSMIDSEKATWIAEPALKALREANPGLDDR